VPNIHVFADIEELSRAAAAAIAQLVAGVTRSRAAFSMALAGGATPGTLYHHLATDFLNATPWAQMHFFWGDERYVATDDEASNYRMAREALLDHVPVPEANVHPIETHFPHPDMAAEAYETVLREHFGGELPRFDLILLGVGHDGHTASLFPESPALQETERWVVPATTPGEPQQRVTLTLPVLNNAAVVYFLAAGPEKAEPVQLTLDDATDPAPCPAAAVRPTEGELHWWLDAAAAGVSAISHSLL